MGDYGGAWRAADTRRAPSPGAKRPRREYGDYDDVPPARGAYGSARGGAGVVPAVGHDVGGYTPRGERYDDGRGAPRGGWREPDALGAAADIVSGQPSNLFLVIHET
ncbi:hypothetical protein R1sor_018034 [Riccia sorocarpa]|uniref:Uncharacterized protein n=1 Tax=Riccia sorocarpa TaxID=122646 RepID=A0ABD3IBB2_9MARC